MNRSRAIIAAKAGFTIIETMISLAIFGVILLMVSVIMINISHLYYKGITESDTQDNTRQIISQVSEDLELNPGQIVNGGPWTAADGATVESVCIGGDVRYSYVVGYRIGSGTEPYDSTIPLVNHVLWRDNPTTAPSTTPIPPQGNPADDPADQPSSSCPVVDVTTLTASEDPGGSELIASDSRLSTFCIGTLDITKINDCDNTSNLKSPFNLYVGVDFGAIDLLTNGTSTAVNPSNITNNTVCAGSTSDQFCATAYLNTTVAQRVGS